MKYTIVDVEMDMELRKTVYQNSVSVTFEKKYNPLIKRSETYRRFDSHEVLKSVLTKIAKNKFLGKELKDKEELKRLVVDKLTDRSDMLFTGDILFEFFNVDNPKEFVCKKPDGESPDGEEHHNEYVVKFDFWGKTCIEVIPGHGIIEYHPAYILIALREEED